MADHLVAFGEVTYDPISGALSKSGKPLRISDRATALLGALIEADNQAVSKQDLMAKAWPAMIVEEGNLTVQIAALRKALGVDAAGNDWIVTVPRMGYRMLMPKPQTVAAIETMVLPSLAVLPFQNMSGDSEQEYFADGMVEDITTALSRFKSFAVIARNSSFTYKGRAVDVRQVAEELGVRYILEGSVRRSGDKLRISAQLVDGKDGTHLWAQNFDGVLDDVFAFQDRITEAVAWIVEPEIQIAEIERSRRERPGSVAVHDLYLRALPKLTAETLSDNAQAYALLTEALALEPDNALVLAKAVLALGHRNSMGWPPIGPDDLGVSAARARRALQLAAGDATVISHCGMMLFHFAKDYDVGMAMVRAAAEANPNDYFVTVDAGIAYLHGGSLEEALACFHRAIRLSPRNPRAHAPLTGIAHAHMALGDYAEALSWATRSLAANANFNATYWMLVAANAHLGRMGEARHFLAELKKVSPGVTVSGIWARQPQKYTDRCATILDGLRLAGLPENPPEAPILPSLAVLPFQNLSSDPEQDYFADGIVEDIITALSRFKSFAVVARNSSFIYKGSAVDVRQVAKELGVRYVLEGTIRRDGNKLRLAAQLIEGATSLQLWAQKFDGPIDELFEFQDRITETVATILEPHIQAAELERSRRERPGSIAVYDLFLQARSRHFSVSAKDNAMAFTLLQQALTVEPNNASVLGLAAFLLSRRNVHCWEQFGSDDDEKCLEYARRGLLHANGDAAVLAHCGDALLQYVKDYDWAMAVIQSAVETNPNYSLVNFVAGVGNLHCGDVEQALRYFERTIRLSPRDPTAYLCITGIAHVHMIKADFQEALLWATKALALNPDNPPTLWIMIAANAKLGRMVEAQRLLAAYRKLSPAITVSTIWAGQPQKYTIRMAAILDGLRLAGLPEN